MGFNGKEVIYNSFYNSISNLHTVYAHAHSTLFACMHIIQLCGLHHANILLLLALQIVSFRLISGWHGDGSSIIQFGHLTSKGEQEVE